jgi:hypothetical protein
VVEAILHPRLLRSSTNLSQAIAGLLVFLVSAERDRFVSDRYQSLRDYRSPCERAGKSGKQIERCVISTFQVTESMGFKHDFRHRGHLLRVGD